MSKATKPPTPSKPATPIPGMGALVDGEDGDMNTFILANMASILRPFADHVWHLEQRIDELTKNLGQTNYTVGVQGTKIEETQESVCVLEKNLKRTDAKLDDTEKLLNQTILEKAALEKDHEETKAHLERTDKLLTQTTTDTNFLMSRLPRLTDATFNRIQQLLEDTVKNIENKIDPTLRQAVTDIANLNKQQTTTAQGLASTSNTVLLHTESLERQAKLQEQHYQDFTKQFMETNATLANLNERMKNFHTGLGLQGDKLQQLDAETRTLHSSFDLHEQKIRALGKRADQIASDLLALSAAFEPVGKEWWEFRKSLGKADDPNAGKRNIYELVAELTEIVMQNKDNIDSLSKRKMHDEWIAKADKCMYDLKQSDGDLILKFDGTYTDLQELIKKVKAIADDLEFQKINLDKTKTSLEKTAGDVKDTQRDVDGLGHKLATTDTRVGQCQQGLHVVNGHFNGMRKGFQASVPMRMQQKESENAEKMDPTRPVVLPKIQYPS